jgi:protein gp37
VPRAWRGRLWRLVRQTPHLDWQVLTKRPENFAADLPWLAKYAGLPPPDGRPWDNVWLGVSVENDRWYGRIDALCRVPAALRFLSCEPLLGPLDLRPWLGGLATCLRCGERQPAGRKFCRGCRKSLAGSRRDDQVGWVIVGGESGNGARPAEVEWARGVVGQCREAKVPVFVKQLGARPLGGGLALKLADRKGGDLEEWPADLRVRQFPPGRPCVLQQPMHSRTG